MLWWNILPTANTTNCSPASSRCLRVAGMVSLLGAPFRRPDLGGGWAETYSAAWEMANRLLLVIQPLDPDPGGR